MPPNDDDEDIRAAHERFEVRTRIAIIIASLGRCDVVREVTRRLAAQTRPPDKICLCVTKTEDAPPPEDADGADIILSPIGSCAQRNAGINHIGNAADIIVFFDDDFVPAPNYIAQLEAYFAANPEIAGVTGHVLRDGVKGLGLTFDEADETISAYRAPAPEKASQQSRPSLYGCNMSFRRAALDGVRFDETLPLYGWLEDVDFSAQARRWGPLVKTDAIAGVHLGAKGGRTSGLRFGYSQIVNPIYLNRKGTMTWSHAADNMGRNFISNHLRVLAPESHIDRWGRVKGNWLAITDILRGKINPSRILSL